MGISEIERFEWHNHSQMLKVDTERWQQSPESLREQALNAPHARTRERFLALYDICQGDSATEVGRRTGRNPQTIMDWVHRFNDAGAESLVYHRTGGHPPLCLKWSSKVLIGFFGKR
jgi:hypothetical protein